MRTCARCGTNYEDNRPACPKCGLPVQNNVQPRKPGQNNNLQRPAGNGQGGNGQNRPNPNNMNRQGMGNGQNRPNPNNQLSQNNMNRNVQNTAPQNRNNNLVQNHNNIDLSTVKLTKAQEKAKDNALMNAMKQAQASGQNFDINAFEKQWIMENVVNKSNNVNNTCAGNETTLFNWIIALVLSNIPIFNLVYSVMCIKNTKFDNTRRNFHKAFLIFYIVMTIISIALTVAIKMM